MTKSEQELRKLERATKKPCLQNSPTWYRESANEVETGQVALEMTVPILSLKSLD